MATYKVLSGSVQFGRTEKKERLVANVGDTLSDKSIPKESLARLVDRGVIELVKEAVEVVEVKRQYNKKDKPVSATEEGSDADKVTAAE